MNNSNEGGLRAPERDPVDWENQDYWNLEIIDEETRRQFDVCHGCRRCFNLCDSFPKLFDLIDQSDTYELDSVDSGSIITARADTGSTKRKGKKPHRGAASRRKVAQKPGKGNKGKGSIHASTKGKGRRSIFKKSVSKGI